MDDILRVGIFQGTGNVQKQPDRFPVRHLFSSQLLECSTWQVLHDKIGCTFILTVIMHTDDVRMVHPSQ